MDEPRRLLGPDGEPVRKRDLLQEIAGPNITGVRNVQSDHPAHGLTPKRLAQLLRSAEDNDPKAYLELAEEMEEKDLHYAGVLGTRKRAVRGLEIHVEPGGEGSAEEDAAVLVREVMEGDGLRDDLVDILDAIGKGYSVTEIIWATEGRLWKPERLEWRDPRWFRPDLIDGRTPHLIEGAGEIPLQPFKFIVHFARAKSGLPIRSGLARLAAWAYMFKNFALKDWAMFVERYGHPMRLGRYGPDAQAEDRQTLLRALRAIGADMAAAIPKSMEVEFITAEGARANAELYEKLVRFWDEQVSKGVLGQVGTTDAIAGGYAVGKVHDGVKDDICEADAEQLAATLRRDLAGPLTVLNFGPGVAVPKLALRRPDEVEIPTLVSAVRTLVPMGLEVPVSHIRGVLGLPEPEEGAELLMSPSAAPRPEMTAMRANAADPAATSLDDLVDALIAENHAVAAAEPMMAPIAQALAGASSLEDLRLRLAELAERAPPEQLVGLLGRAGFAAELTGLTGAEISDQARLAEE